MGLPSRWNESIDYKTKGEELEKALETLRHEFLDYAISKVVEPYKQVANKLIAFVNEEAYRRKERLIEGLARLV